MLNDSTLALGFELITFQDIYSKALYVQQIPAHDCYDNLVGEWEINLTGMHCVLGLHPCLQE